jgi:hypothetical protein
MNCRHCGSPIDYRFSTTCLNCDCELIQAGTDSQPLKESKHKESAHLEVRHHLVNVTTTLAAIVAGLFVGAVVTPFGGWGVYYLLYKAHIVGDLSCGDGNALGFLLLIGGANIGSVSCGILGFAHRYYRAGMSRV